MMGQTDRELVERDIKKRLFRLYNLPEHPQKAALANLRRGVGHVPGGAAGAVGRISSGFSAGA